MTADVGRLIVISIWAATGTLLGLTVSFLTNRLWAGLITQIVALGALAFLVWEPMHPVGLSSLLLAALLAVVAFGGRGSGPAPVAVGVLLAALLLTKINVGAFAAVAILVAAALSFRTPLWVRGCVVAFALCVPAALLSPDLDQAWVAKLLVLVDAGIVAVVVAASSLGGSVPGWGWFGQVVTAGAAFSAALLVGALALGTSVHGLIDGLLLEPGGMRNLFSLPLRWPAVTVAAAIGSVAGAIGMAYANRRPGRLSTVEQAM